MTEDQIQRVKRTFSALMPRADLLARRFYERLFQSDPALRRLFAADMTEQRSKLMLTLSTVVFELHNLEAILPSVADLARRHVAYGVAPEHYQLVGSALLGALEEVCQPFDAQDLQAWSAAYGLLSRAMVKAAYSDGAAA